MKIEGNIYALSTFFAIYIFVFTPINMLNLGMPGLFLTGVIPAFIVGYVFAGKMSKAKVTSIGKILSLATVLVAVFLPGLIGFVDWNNFQASNPSSTLPASEFMAYMGRQTFIFITFNLAFLLPAMFIGLYIGSALKKPQLR